VTQVTLLTYKLCVPLITDNLVPKQTYVENWVRLPADPVYLDNADQNR